MNNNNTDDSDFSQSNMGAQNINGSQDTQESQNTHEAYWQANIKLVLGCLAVWFIVSFGCGVLFVEQLNAIRMGGFKLGFWFAQQGSIYTFLALIFFYVHQMNKLDKKFNVHD